MYTVNEFENLPENHCSISMTYFMENYKMLFKRIKRKQRIEKNKTLENHYFYLNRIRGFRANALAPAAPQQTTTTPTQVLCMNTTCALFANVNVQRTRDVQCTYKVPLSLFS